MTNNDGLGKFVDDVFSYVSGSGPQVEAQMKADIERLIAAVREERKAEYDKLLEDDDYLRHYNNTLLEQINKLNDKVSASRAEGVAAERERIARGSQRFSQGDDVSDSDYITADYATKIDFAAIADCELFATPASLLAPDKESEK